MLTPTQELARHVTAEELEALAQRLRDNPNYAWLAAEVISDDLFWRIQQTEDGAYNRLFGAVLGGKSNSEQAALFVQYAAAVRAGE